MNKHRGLIYFLWFGFYILLFGFFTAFLIIPFYLVCFIFVFTPLAEKLWRIISGVRPLRLKKEKDRLFPLFKEVYLESIPISPTMPRKIRLHIQEDMSINAFAFGRSTLVLTKGSINLLSDDCLKGLMAHEFGHFANRDTKYALIASVGNLPLSLTIKLLSKIKMKLDEASRYSLFTSIIKGFFDLLYYAFKGVEFVGDLIIMRSRRRSEYVADAYAFRFGYGEHLAEALIQIYEISMEKPKSVKEMLKSTHPPITMQIQLIESYELR